MSATQKEMAILRTATAWATVVAIAAIVGITAFLWWLTSVFL